MSSKQPSVSNIALGIAGLTGGLAIALLIHNPTAYGIGTVVGATIVGLLCGCLPFYQARKVGDFNFAQIALASCTLAGLLLGIILALPVAIVLTIVINTRPKP